MLHLKLYQINFGKSVKDITFCEKVMLHKGSSKAMPSSSFGQHVKFVSPSKSLLVYLFSINENVSYPLCLINRIINPRILPLILTPI